MGRFIQLECLRDVQNFMEPLQTFIIILLQDLKLTIRQPVLLFAPVGFIFISLLLFVLGLEPSPGELRKISPALLMTLALLSSLINIDHLFRSLYQSKHHVHLLLGTFSLNQLVWLKIVWHWLVTGLPILLASPLLALMLYLNQLDFLYLLLVLFLVTMILSLWAVFCGAITSDSTRGHQVAPILIFPMVIPTLICATMALRSAFLLGPFWPFVALLVANFLVLALILPWVVAKVIDAIWRG